MGVDTRSGETDDGIHETNADTDTDTDDGGEPKGWRVSGTVRFSDALFPPPWGGDAVTIRLNTPGLLGSSHAEVKVQTNLEPGWSAAYELVVGERPEGDLVVQASFRAPGEGFPPMFWGQHTLSATDGSDTDPEVVLVDLTISEATETDGDAYCGTDPLDSYERACVFEFLWRFAWLNSPFLVPKSVDWEGTRSSFRTEALSAIDDAAFYRIVARMVASLKDQHWLYVGLPLVAQYIATPPIPAVLYDGAIYIAESPNLPAGVAAGDQVTGLDGADIDVRLAEARDLFSNHHRLRFEALARPFLLAGPLASEAVIDVLTAAGPSTIKVKRDQLFDTQALLNPVANPTEELVVAQVYPTSQGDVAYLRITTFYHHGLSQAFDDALAPYAEAAAVIVDVRGNSGGWIDQMHAVVGRFIGQELHTHDVVFGTGKRTPVVVQPAGSWHFTGPVVVLIDETSYSASSMFASTMRDRGASLVGRPTGGGTSPVGYERYRLTSESYLSTSSDRYYDLEAHGPTVDMMGVEPDIVVPLTLEDVLSGVAFDYAGPSDLGIASALAALP